jgi:hypothetical protein
VIYNPFNWYWLVTGNVSQVFSSAAGNYVPVGDATYVAWLNGGSSPSRIVSEQELLEVLAAQAPSVKAQFKAGLLAYAQAKASGLIAGLNSYTADGVTIKSDATATTRTDLNARAAWGASNQTASDPWIDNLGGVTEVTGAQYVALAPLVTNYWLSIYPALATVLTAINASPPTITTFAEIDSAAWPANS